MTACKTKKISLRSFLLTGHKINESQNFAQSCLMLQCGITLRGAKRHHRFLFPVWDLLTSYPRFPVPLIEFFIRYALFSVRPQRDSEVEPSYRLTVRDYHNLPVYPFGDRAKSESITGCAMGYRR